MWTAFYYFALQLNQFCDCIPLLCGIYWTVTGLDKDCSFFLNDLFTLVPEENLLLPAGSEWFDHARAPAYVFMLKGSMILIRAPVINLEKEHS
jgi:hypothetical protein